MTMRVLSGAATDSLTHCYIKDHLVPCLKELEAEHAITKKPFSVLILDVDHFKSFNDKHGHLHGDEVLKYFSSSLHLNLVDYENIPFRFGGDEFVVVFPGKPSRYVHHLAAQLQKSIKSRMFLLKGKQYLTSFSGGVACYPDDAKTVEDLLHKADQALYISKRHGRARATRFSQIYPDRVKHFFLLLGTAAAVVGAGIAYRAELSGFWRHLRSARIMVGPKENPKTYFVPSGVGTKEDLLDEVILKSGDVLKGRILTETAAEIKINLKLDRGEATLAVPRSDIASIRKKALPAA